MGKATAQLVQNQFLLSLPSLAEYAGKTNPFGLEAAGEGAKIFKTNCETCHGPQGHGDGPAGAALDPRPKDLSELQKVASDDYLFWRISEGKEGTSMVAWKGILTEEQIWQVISFIRTYEVRPVLFSDLFHELYLFYLSEEYNNQKISRITNANFFRNSCT